VQDHFEDAIAANIMIEGRLAIILSTNYPAYNNTPEEYQHRA